MADTLTAHVLDGYAAGRVDPTRWSNVAQPAPRVPNLPIRLHLTMTDHTLLTGTGIAWLAGEPVTAGTADELLTAASVELRRVFADPAGRPIAMESASRYFPDGLADLIRLRDRHCQTPWCDAPIREIDHITPWTNGGPTTYTNGQGLCTRCNHAKQAQENKLTTGAAAAPLDPALPPPRREGAPTSPKSSTRPRTPPLLTIQSHPQASHSLGRPVGLARPPASRVRQRRPVSQPAGTPPPPHRTPARQPGCRARSTRKRGVRAPPPWRRSPPGTPTTRRKGRRAPPAGDLGRIGA